MLNKIFVFYLTLQDWCNCSFISSQQGESFSYGFQSAPLCAVPAALRRLFTGWFSRVIRRSRATIFLLWPGFVSHTLHTLSKYWRQHCVTALSWFHAMREHHLEIDLVSWFFIYYPRTWLISDLLYHLNSSEGMRWKLWIFHERQQFFTQSFSHSLPSTMSLTEI